MIAELQTEKLHIKTKERYEILDILRGIALLGICLANYPEFALYTFQGSGFTESLPTAPIDHVVRYFQYLFIDGKFYTLFSLLFGIGFSIIISKTFENGRNGISFFYRRMFIIAFIGLAHMLLLWAGDILLLYAVIGLLLPLFRKMPDKKLLITSFLLLLFPIFINALITVTHIDPALPAKQGNQYINQLVGITEESFPVWLLEKKSYTDVLKFNLAGSFIRIQEFIDGNRVFKVLGLFLIGLYIGRNRLFTDTEANKTLIRKVRNYGLLIGVPLSCLYSWNAMTNQLGLVWTSVLYTLSVFPLGFSYAAIIFLWYSKHKQNRVFKHLAAPGRMALTNYIGQSILGIILFYGVGFSLALKTGLIHIELIALGVFLFQLLSSQIWLRYFQYGILEWIWRILTYGKWLKILK